MTAGGWSIWREPAPGRRECSKCYYYRRRYRRPRPALLEEIRQMKVKHGNKEIDANDEDIYPSLQGGSGIEEPIHLDVESGSEDEVKGSTGRQLKMRPN